MTRTLVTEWCFANAVAATNAKEEMMPSKQRRRREAKVDSVQTHCMASQMATDIEADEAEEIDFLC